MDTVNNKDRYDTTEDDYGVRWGRLKSVQAERFKYYDSFHLDGVEFFVKDIVYLQASDGPPYIAQIGKLRENIETGKKSMLVYWFFRPCELPEGLPSVNYSENSKEIFIAVGSSYAQMFENPACTIKKCRVVCIAKETWNRMPSAEQVAAADHVFKRAFNPVKLRLEKLDPAKKNCSENIRLRLSGKRSNRSGQAVKGKGELRRDVVTINKNVSMHSKMVIMGKPTNHHEMEHRGKLKPSHKYPSGFPSSTGKALQRLDSGERPRGDISEEQIPMKATTGEWKNEDRLLKPSGKQDHTNSEKRRRIDDPESGKGDGKQAHIPTSRVLERGKFSSQPGKQDHTNSEKRRRVDDPVSGKGDGRQAHISTSREEDRGKLSSQAAKKCAEPWDRLPKVPKLGGEKAFEMKPEGWMPGTSKNSGRHVGVRRDGEGGGASVLSKRPREDSCPSATAKKMLANDRRPDKRVGEGHLESTSLRLHILRSQKPGSSLPEHKRSEATVREGRKDGRAGADLNKDTSVKVLREVKLGTRESKDDRKQHSLQHLASTPRTANGQRALNPNGISGKIDKDTRLLVKAHGSAAEDEVGRKKISKSLPQVPPELPERATGREVQEGAHCRRVADSDGLATDHGTALLAENHYKLYVPNKKIFKFPWEEKKSMEEAITSGRALLLKNLDPCLNSVELEGILEDVLDTTCDARILPPKTITCYKSAEAVVIFKKAEIAEDVLRTLTENLLLTSEDERPVIASLLTKPKQSINNFHGFFKLEKFGWKMNDSVDQKNAVATSHCAQTNTVEYDMGLHWRVLQERDTLEWQMLEDDHQKEIQVLRAKYLKASS